MSPEQEFEQRLDVHRRDSKSCAIFLYTLLTTHTLAGSDFGLFDRVNAHAGFWNGTLAGLQAAAYIALGRIYDPNDSNYNALALLASRRSTSASSRVPLYKPERSASECHPTTPCATFRKRSRNTSRSGPISRRFNPR